MNKVYIVGNYIKIYENDPGTWKEHSYHATLKSANIVCNKLNELLNKHHNSLETKFEVIEDELYSVSYEYELDTTYRVDLTRNGLILR